MIFDTTRVLATMHCYYPRKIREALEIRKTKKNFNSDNSFQVARTWNPDIYKLMSVL